MRDGCNLQGAMRLADQIRKHWARRGCVVNVQIIQPNSRAIYEIRSDMVNGLPLDYRGQLVA